MLRAFFPGESSLPAYAAGRVWLQIHAVPSGERKEIERALLDHGLRLLHAWLDDAEAAGSTWRATSHSFWLRCADGAIQASSD